MSKEVEINNWGDKIYSTVSGDIIVDSNTDAEYKQILSDLEKLLKEGSKHKLLNSQEIYIVEDAISCAKRQDKKSLKKALKVISGKVLSVAKELSLSVLGNYISEKIL